MVKAFDAAANDVFDKCAATTDKQPMLFGGDEIAGEVRDNAELTMWG